MKSSLFLEHTQNAKISHSNHADDDDDTVWEDVDDDIHMDIHDINAHSEIVTCKRKPRRRSYNKSAKKAILKSNSSKIDTKLTFYDILQADINNNNYDEQFHSLLQINPTPTIRDLHSHFPYLQHHWDGPYQQTFEEDHPSLCEYYGNLFQKKHDIFISSPDYQLQHVYIPLIYPNIAFDKYIPQPIDPKLWNKVFPLPASWRPTTYDELLHYATLNDLPLPIPPTLYNEICIKEPSISDEDEDSEENYDTYDDPDPEDADLGDNIETELDDDDNEDADPQIDDDYLDSI